jgi:signal transduction histidine kinase
VLDNLLANAVKYSPAGGAIEIWAGVDHDPAGGDWACLTVRDHGVGIPVTDLPQLFTRFYRGANVLGRFRGTGMGLAGARQILEQHGGTITVESAEGAGSTFTVRLPLDTPDAPPELLDAAGSSAAVNAAPG